MIKTRMLILGRYWQSVWMLSRMSLDWLVLKTNGWKGSTIKRIIGNGSKPEVCSWFLTLRNYNESFIALLDTGSPPCHNLLLPGVSLSSELSQVE